MSNRRFELFIVHSGFGNIEVKIPNGVRKTFRPYQLAEAVTYRDDQCRKKGIELHHSPGDNYVSVVAPKAVKRQYHPNKQGVMTYRAKCSDGTELIVPIEEGRTESKALNEACLWLEQAEGSHPNV